MKTLKQIWNLLVNNLVYSIGLVLGIVLFGIYCDGLWAGIITALSALLIYVCITLLYQEYQKKYSKTK